MPDVLKACCIEAFERLHAQGILHGNAELRHMLISADAKVTIIDFKVAATSIPLENVKMEEVGLRKATPEEFRLEMRRVRFKLDYDDAREEEREKLARKRRGELGKEDLLDPPVDIHVLLFQWLEGCERPPTRFVVPGQTKEQVELAVRRFLRKVREMDRQMGKKPPAGRKRKSVSEIMEEGTHVPEVPVAPPRQKLKVRLPPFSAPSSPVRGVPGSVSLLPPPEIFHITEPPPELPKSLIELPPLAVEEASLQPGPSTESLTEDKAITHPYESEPASLGPRFGSSSHGTFEFPVGKWPDGETVHPSGKESSLDTALQATRKAPPSASRSSDSTFPIMRTFADVVRKAIQVFGRITPVQLAAYPSQLKKTVDSSRKKRRLSESSASESSEYEALAQRKKLRRSASSSLPSEPTPRPVPRTWSLTTMDQSKRATKRKRESEETSRLVWNTEEELRKKRCKLSELSNLSDASGSETEGDTRGERMNRLGKSLTGTVASRSAVPPDAFSSPKRDTVLQSDKRTPPIIIRDYAYMSHNVPKAPYVPHPPTENRMAAERAKHICLSNAEACLNAGLQYPTTENEQGKLVPDFSRSPYMFSAETFQEKRERKRREKAVGVEKAQRSFGSLKRKLGAQRAGASAGFEDMLLADWKDAGHRLKKRVTGKVRFSMENLLGDAHSSSGGVDSGVLRKVVKETSGILKRRPPVKVFNYQVPWGAEDDDVLSPKVGPEPESFDRSGGFGMLGVWVNDTRTKTEEAFREECALRVYKSQKTIEGVDAEWREEEERMGEVRRRELESSAIGL